MRNKTCAYKTFYMNAHRSIFLISKKWKPPKHSTDEQMNKIWYIYMMEYYSAIKRPEVHTYAKMWMKLENRLKEARQKKPHNA